MPREDFLKHLRRVNSERAQLWSQGGGEDPLFAAAEFGGEAGEVQNVVKKLVREARGWKGSRDTVEHLAEEIGDVVICLDNLARAYGIDIADATARKFNKTSEANDFPQRLEVPSDAKPVQNGPKLYEMEQEIMGCWNVTNDIDTLYKNVMDYTEYNKLDSDQVANFLLGLKTIYDMKFEHLFDLYERIIRAQAGR